MTTGEKLVYHSAQIAAVTLLLTATAWGLKTLYSLFL